MNSLLINESGGIRLFHQLDLLKDGWCSRVGKLDSLFRFLVGEGDRAAVVERAVISAGHAAIPALKEVAPAAKAFRVGLLPRGTGVDDRKQ